MNVQSILYIDRITFACLYDRDFKELLAVFLFGQLL